MVTASVFVFQRREPDVARPYRTWGYPVVPAVFVLVTIYLIGYTLYNAPRMSILGLLIIAVVFRFICIFRRTRSGAD